MKLYTVVATGFVALAFASPAQLAARQITSNELGKGACKSMIFIFARASTEPGNMGMSMGPKVCSGLKSKVGRNLVACQGVGGAYRAGLETNALPEGTNKAAYQEAMKLFEKAATGCPQAKIVAGGYSQGSAVMMNAVSKSPPNVRDRIKGVVLFGYTKNKQQRSGIPNYPKERVKVFCQQSDGVCWGQLLVTPGHFAYGGDGPAAVQFLINAANR